MHKESIMQPICDRELHEECGVFGVVGVPDAANLTYYGLHSLQHRGQEGCGIVSVSKEGAMRRVRGEGLVTEVFNEAKLANLAGDMAIGHVRYSTAGGGGTENIQPFLFHHNTGDFALAHNGNIVNADLLRNYLENKGSLFQSTSDSEVFAHLIKKEVRNHNRPRIYSIIEALNMLEGAFAFLVMTANRIYACRDKHGLRPLSIGKLGGGYVVSSETCAFEVVGAEFVRDVEPGEIVTIDRHGIRSSDYSMFKRHMMCAMEYIYFARPDSDIEGRNVHGISHITGGGFDENIPRILSEGQGIEIHEGTWEILPVFRLLEKYGKIAHREMFNIFNMGIGMVIAVSQDEASEVIAILEKQGEKASVIGRATNRPGVEIR